MLLGVAAVWGVAESLPPRADFDHVAHAGLFPGSCTTCHAGAAESGPAIWPAAAACATCHDGEVADRVDWSPPTDPPPSNLRFEHAEHRRESGDSVGCASCHEEATVRDAVHRSDATQCVSCHEPGVPHLAASDRQCAACHLTLAQATTLSREDVGRFSVPPSHARAGFSLAGHGESATATRQAVAASCATCHARNFCLACHVDAPEVVAIQALATDQRSTVHPAHFREPPSHEAATFVEAHGGDARRDPSRCATCHAQPSCAACHVGQPAGAVAALPAPGPGRAVGAVIARQPPASHTVAFTEGHGPQASASPQACSTCHVRQQCLTCHRGEVGGGDYHPRDFLTRHPAAAYNRQTSCGDCHNVQQFCVTCHASVGLGARNTLTSGPYHDAKGAFVVGHGQAARQSLESCVSCHVERDCTACHSAIGGRRFSPHGPGFDPERLRRRNPEMCIACHGMAIPGA
jgi:hypothetical protein